MTYQGRNWKNTFRERFCEEYQVAPPDFERAVFFKCLHLHAWPLAKFLYARNRRIFREDIEFIHELGGIRDPLIFKSEVNRYHGRNVRDKGLIRGFFAIRVSGKRVLKLKTRLFREAS